MAMHIDRLIKAVETAAETDLSYQGELDELLELKSRMVKGIIGYDEWDLEVVAISTGSFIDIMNQATYDIYGKTYKGIDGYAPQTSKLSIKDAYFRHIRSWYPGMTDSSIEMAWEVISDLWGENESNGYNMPDGSYNKFEGLDKEDLENMCRYLHYSVKMYR